MATRKYKRKSRRVTRSKRSKSNRRRRGGLSLFRDPQCYLGYDNVKRIADSDIDGYKQSNLARKCNCRPDSQKSTCINLADIKSKKNILNNNSAIDLQNSYY
jgi:hypothetical protein